MPKKKQVRGDGGAKKPGKKKKHHLAKRIPARNAEFEMKRAKALKLRVAGATNAQIAEELGCSYDAAKQLVARALVKYRESAVSDAAQLRAIAHERFETLIRSLWKKAVVEHDVTAVREIARVVERDSKLLGYAAPQRHRVDLIHLQAQIGTVVEMICRVVSDEDVPRVVEAVEQALEIVQRKDRSLDGSGSDEEETA